MKLKDILKDIAVSELHAEPETEISDIYYDSRAVAPGGLFVAIRGFEADGHRYIGAAAEKGAACVICEEPPSGDVPYVLVGDSRLALAICSRNFFGDPSSEMTVIGVTGTNGKTTTTYLIKHLLEFCLDAKVGLIGTNGNMIGSEFIHTERTTPESYELQKLFAGMLEAGCTHVVMEVSSHSLVLERVAGIRFAVGIFTNLTQDHLDFHKDMTDYALAKAKLFSMCEKGAFNIDDGWAELLIRRAACQVFTFSEKDNKADLVAKDIRLSASGVRFCALHGDDLQRVKLGIPGLFSVYNALGVIACGLMLGLPLKACAEALEGAKGVKGRVEVVPTDGDYTIIIDYAHTPDALENVLKSMKKVAPARVVALFGCGGDRDRTKRSIMGRIAAENADYVIVTSDNPRTEEPEAIIADIVEGLKGTKTPHKVITSRPEAIAWAIEKHRPDDLIVLAGKGHEDYQIIGKTKYHMDEREIVAEILDKRKNNQ
jgi:UDP-N-acetylmuramoyl-L-alanyl-D-glutamate--2,6-diaminopimelate ligase